MSEPILLPRWRPADGLTEKRGTDGRGTAPLDEFDLRYYTKFTVFLGASGNFDYWGNPENGAVIYVGDPFGGCLTGGFGDRSYWRSMRFNEGMGRVLTPEGRTW